MCREKGAIRHDDRIDALAQGVQYYTDAMGISALEEIKNRKRNEWNSMLEEFFDDPQSSANHLVMGMNFEQRQQAKGNSKTSVPTWV
jgi:general stress protein 26